MSEHTEQAALFSWADLQMGRWPELRMMYAVPNGGHRHKATAAKLKAEGVRAGVPDICLPVARHGYHGLYIEMKYGRNTPTEEQTAWLDALSEQGYLAVVCWGYDEAKRAIEEYLESAE